ncbi:hypothetical protein V5799_021107 [Amblyomma americanum]|uniref:Uncharacterized protein n=1 Tax=Amblyomma americanum TaxID=6943 RepID=A0AAQ4FS06_AMBAM
MTHHCPYRLELLQLASTRSCSFVLYEQLLGSEWLVDFGEMCALHTEAGSVPLLYGALVSVLRVVQALEHLGNFALKKRPITVPSECEMSHDTEHDGRHDHMDEPGVNAGHNDMTFRAQRTMLLVSHGSGRLDRGDQLVLLVPHHAVTGLSSLAPDTLVPPPPGYRCHEEAELLADFRHGSSRPLVESSVALQTTLRRHLEFRPVFISSMTWQTSLICETLSRLLPKASLTTPVLRMIYPARGSSSDTSKNLGTSCWSCPGLYSQSSSSPGGPAGRLPSAVLRCHRKRSGRTLAPKHAA